MHHRHHFYHTSFGRHTRSELGTKILLMQGPDAWSDAGLDAVIFAAEDTFSPDGIALSTPPRPPVAVTVEWRKTVARATPISYGLNAFGGFNPDITQNASYEANMISMNAGLIRLHNASLMNESKTDSNGLTDFITRFAAATAPHLDFFSYHAYASGSKYDSDTQIFDRTEFFGGATNRIVAILKGAILKRPIPVFFDEHNISWIWETRDPRMTNVKGAIFDVLTMVSAVTNGADCTLAWSEKDGIYGKMDDSYHPRPCMRTFALFNRYLVGSLASAATSAPEAVVACAVQSAAPSRKSVLLINRSGHDCSVVLTMS